MLSHYLTIAFRNLVRNKAYSIINILGLAIALAACLMIGLYIRYETSFDQFHKGSENIYRVVQQWGDDNGNRMAVSGAPMNQNLLKDFPEIEEGVRIHYKSSLLEVNENGNSDFYREEKLVYGEENFFDFFSFELLEGEAATVLNKPNTIVLTESVAQKYFEDENPVGKTIMLDETYPLTITGIMKDVPAQSHVQFELIVSYSTLAQVYGMTEFTSWWFPAFYSYVKVHPETDIEALNEDKLKTFISQYREEGLNIYPRLQPITDIRLHGNPAGEGTFAYVIVFLSISIFVLLIACMNFMNLSTARSATRALEVGVRKVVGAQRGNLIRQFLGEAFLVCLIAMMIGLGIAELILPMFNEMAGLELMMPWNEPVLWLGLGAFVILITFLAGTYPAFFLSRFNPIQVLKSKSSMSDRGSWLRKGLVTFQFVVSVSLIVCTLIINNQQQFMLSRSLGFEKENILNVSLKDNKVKAGLEAFKQKLLQQPQIKAVSGSNWVPGTTFISTMPAQLQNETGEMEDFTGSVLYVDHDFLDVMNIPLADGRFFSRDFTTDGTEAFLINQKALEKTGTAAMDKRARIYYAEYGNVIFEKKGEVIGVLEDFHYYDLHREVGPVLITLSDPSQKGQNFTDCLIRTHPGDTREVVATIEKIWKETFPSRPFEFAFANEKLNQAYETEMRLGGIVSAFTFFAIFIACLGLLGLAAFTAQQKTKEIGIRKVLGASTKNILILLNKEFTWLVLFSLLIAFPVSYFLMDYWLQDYPYKIGFSVVPYFVAFLATMVITWMTVGTFALRAAFSNPVEALRYE